MSDQYRVLDPTTRSQITVIAPNNNSAPLLDDLVFRDTVTTRTLTLSATEPIDSLVMSLKNIVVTTLNSTESIDTISADIKNIINLDLSQTENIDTLEMSAKNIINADINDTDSIDTANITATNSSPRNAELNATETPDKAVIRISRPQIYSRSKLSSIYTHGFQRVFLNNAKLEVKESPDRARVELTTETFSIVFASENQDGFKAYTKNQNKASVRISENIDGIVNDEEKFKAQVKEIYDRYEQEQIMFILNVA